MAMTALTPVTATAVVSTTPVVRLMAVAKPTVVPMVVQHWGIRPWIDDRDGLPLYWSVDTQTLQPVSLQPVAAKASSVTQRSEGVFRVEVSLAPGVTLEATPRGGWNVPVVTLSTGVRQVREVVRLQGQVAMTAQVPMAAPVVSEHDVLDAQTGAVLVPSVSAAGVVWVARAGVGYVVVTYETTVVALIANFGIESSPWTNEVRERMLHELVFAGEVGEAPLLMLRIEARDPVTKKTQSEAVQESMVLSCFVHQFGASPAGDKVDEVDDSKDMVYMETSRKTKPVRVTSTSDPTLWVNVDVATQIVMAQEATTGGQTKTLTLNFKAPT